MLRNGTTMPCICHLLKQHWLWDKKLAKVCMPPQIQICQTALVPQGKATHAQACASPMKKVTDAAARTWNTYECMSAYMLTYLKLVDLNPTKVLGHGPRLAAVQLHICESERACSPKTPLPYISETSSCIDYAAVQPQCVQAQMLSAQRMQGSTKPFSSAELRHC